MSVISKAMILSAAAGSQSAEIYTAERCYITELFNSAADATLSVARARVVPGVQTQLHSLDVTERYLIEQGEGLLELAGGQEVPVGVGDSALIPAGCAQRITNVGQVDLLFLCVCTPRFLPEHYTNLEPEE